MRRPIGLDMNMLEIVTLMAEGNPGAVNVCQLVLSHEAENQQHGVMRILDLDDMNIRGCQLWVAYKDHCKEKIEDFIQAIKNRDPEMVRVVNENSGIEELAVVAGGSRRD